MAAVGAASGEGAEGAVAGMKSGLLRVAGAESPAMSAVGVALGLAQRGTGVETGCRISDGVGLLR